MATAISFASLPVLARYGPGGARQAGFQHTLGLGMKAALMLIVPATVALIVLRVPIVRLLYQRGVFGAEGVELTARALLFYAPQLPFVALDQLPIAAFYAVQNTRLPVLVGVAARGSTPSSPWGTVDRLGMSGPRSGQHGAEQRPRPDPAPVPLAGHGGPGAAPDRRHRAARRRRRRLYGGDLAVVVALAPVPAGAVGLRSTLTLAGVLSGLVYLGALALLGSTEVGLTRDLVLARLARRRPVPE